MTTRLRRGRPTPSAHQRPLRAPLAAALSFAVFTSLSAAATPPEPSPPQLGDIAQSYLPPEFRDSFDPNQPSASQSASRTPYPNLLHRDPAGHTVHPTGTDALPLAAEALESALEDSLVDLQVTPEQSALEISLSDNANYPASEATARSVAQEFKVGLMATPSNHPTKKERELAALTIADSQLAKDLDITLLAANEDSSAVVIYSGQRQLASAERTAIRSLVKIPVKFASGTTSAAPEVGTRWNDRPAFYDGSAIRIGSKNGSLCTAGFAVIHKGYGKLATARHCDPEGKSDIFTPAGVKIASKNTSARYSGLDSMLIDPIASPATAAYVYRGGWATSQASSVRNWYSNHKGERVCRSGASTGERCGTIINDFALIPGVTSKIGIHVRAEKTILSAPGDSGGPWFLPLSQGVQARGIHWGRFTQDGKSHVVSCDSATRPDTPYCSEESLYVPISTILNHFGAKLEVR